MAKKKVKAIVKIQMEAGKATPAPPVGTALGPHGVNIMEFVKTYNDRTGSMAGQVIPVEITIFEDRTFTFVTKTPPAAALLKKAAGVEKGSAKPNKEKVGKDLSEAIFSGHNNTVKFADVPRLGVKVERGMTHDGLGKYLSEIITKAPGPTADIVGILRATRTDVVVNYLPVGSEEAVKWYAEQVLEAGCAFVNCMPVFLAREPYWRDRFEKRGIPIIGDDIKSQVGATIVHRILTRLFEDRGVKLERTYQLNFGGNTDFLNMLERERLTSKKISKTNSVKSQMAVDIGADNIHIGPSDYVPWLGDRKWAYIRLEGRSFGDVPLNIELKLEVWDSPNSAGVVIDAVRCCKLGLDRKIGGALDAPSSYFMKSPPVQFTDSVAHLKTEAFIAGTSTSGEAKTAPVLPVRAARETARRR